MKNCKDCKFKGRIKRDCTMLCKELKTRIIYVTSHNCPRFERDISQWRFEGKDLTTSKANEMRSNSRDFTYDVQTLIIKRRVVDGKGGRYMKKQVVWIYLEGDLQKKDKAVWREALRILNDRFEYRLLASPIADKGTVYSRRAKESDFMK